jgi:hypothetical protein
MKTIIKIASNLCEPFLIGTGLGFIIVEILKGFK